MLVAEPSPLRHRSLLGKKGAAFTLKDDNVSKIKTLCPSWYYCWGPKPSPILHPLDLQGPPDQHRLPSFLPMIWGYYPKFFDKTVQQIRKQHPRMILTFNEPDNVKQSNVSVAKALQVWPQLEAAALSPAVEGENDIDTAPTPTTLPTPPPPPPPLLVSPGCVQPLGPWMKEFMAQVERRQLRVDVLAVHYYGGANVQNFRTQMRKIHETYGGHRPLLITEMAVADWKAKTTVENRFSPTRVLEFMAAVLPWMQAQEWIVGYAWFSFSIKDPHGTSSALFDASGQSLTPLGKYYASFLAPIPPLAPQPAGENADALRTTPTTTSKSTKKCVLQ